MANRPPEQLQQDQMSILQDYKARLSEREPGAPTAVPPQPRSSVQWGRVTEVVSEHAQYGPHVVVQICYYSGSPPVLLDAVAAPIRCYPSPGWSVAQYSVDDYVRLTPVRGAIIAEPVV